MCICDLAVICVPGKIRRIFAGCSSSRILSREIYKNYVCFSLLAVKNGCLYGGHWSRPVTRKCDTFAIYLCIDTSEKPPQQGIKDDIWEVIAVSMASSLLRYSGFAQFYGQWQRRQSQLRRVTESVPLGFCVISDWKKSNQWRSCRALLFEKCVK